MDYKKITKGIERLTASRSQIAKALKISPPRVTQLVQEGVLVCDENGDLPIVANIQNYDHYKLSGGDIAELNYMDEKARHEKAKADIAEIKLARMQGSVYDAHAVELAITEEYSNLRTQLLGLPSKLALLLEDRDKEYIYETMTREIEEKLAELSVYSPELFTREELADGDEDY